ncbi:XRE family transcriptional regulator [Nocardiopsis changdeensis]|uniref:Cupin domain-containing protein n=1 Tax=Nocardiopsis changdeensis TaxID=2831969 RepID=A0ABX8BW16_9ACTN|nr:MULTISPECIES: XRE family transcriptional regulator [Nocardiopsis]QUX25312.1 cupin domain-containing protein [Nocardiopsis changdeensis]QYX35699.1 XRE family transcriptional regulator [Nocardiopsis sp. MT53]
MPNDQTGAEAGVGSRLRRRRRALHLTLKDVAEQTGLTEGYLSQIERDQANASVRTLQRLCAVLKLSVGDLFAPPGAAASAVLRFSDTRGMAFGEGATKVKLTPGAFDHLEVLLGHFEPGGSTGVEPCTHGDSEEILLVLSGEVEVQVDGQVHRLSALDSIHYRSSSPHKVVETTGREEARVLWAIAPPTY